MKTLIFAAAVVFALGSNGLFGQLAPPPVPKGLQVDPEPAALNRVLNQLHNGKAQEALSQANELLRSYPDSIWLNCAAGEAALVNQDQLSLHNVLERLKALSPEGRERCFAKLNTQYRQATASVEIRSRALNLVKAGKLDDARRMVAGAHLEPYEELLIEHYLDRAQAHFSNALVDLQTLKVREPSAAAQATALYEETMRQASQFRDSQERLQAYLFDPFASSACSPENVRDMFAKKSFSLEEFLGIARDLAHDYPSNPNAQQFYFMAQVLAGSDESVKRYGDAVLTRYGKLTIPFFSKDTFYVLVVDRGKQSIALKENPTHAKNLGFTDGLRNGQEFDLAYSAVLSFHQVVSSNLVTLGLSDKSAAIDLGAQGVAPYYALMPAIHCLYGERYERGATERLGRFLARELDLPAERVKLVNPDAITHDSLGTFLSTVTVISAITNQTAIAHQQQTAANNQAVQNTLAWQQLQAEMIQEQAQDIMLQQQSISADRQDVNSTQQQEKASLEEGLTEMGFDRALDLDVPGYLDILSSMLQNQN